MKNSQLDSKMLFQLKRPVKTSESYMMLKEDSSLNQSPLKKLNSNYAELREEKLVQIKFHMLLPTMEEPLDSHTQILKLMMLLKLILLLELLLISLNSKLVTSPSPHQETILEELVSLLTEKDIWEDSISSTFKMKEAINLPPESATSSLLEKERNHGSLYQRATVFIYPQLKPNTKLKRKTRKRNTDSRLVDNFHTYLLLISYQDQFSRFIMLDLFSL